MARWFTSDWHIDGQFLIEKNIRPFNSVQTMNTFLIRNANRVAQLPTDMIIHIGDLRQVNNITTRDKIETSMTQANIMSSLAAQLICIEGNHDSNNRVKTVAKSIRTSLGKQFRSVVCCHYPSTDPRSTGHFQPYDIVIHGHCHSGITGKNEIFHFDANHKVLNVNVACDLWKYQIVSEDQLIRAINKYLSDHKKDAEVNI